MSIKVEVHDGEAGWPLAEALDHECYPPEVMATIVWRDVTWAHADLRILVRELNKTVCHVGLYFRQGKDSDAPCDIGGIGGVMTAPAVRGRGHAGRAMRLAADMMEYRGRDFGLLFCEPQNVAFYERLGWGIFDGDVFCEQPSGRIKFDMMHAMVLPLRCAPRSRVIDLCGLPW
jgi:aminoglycoside 2'-N-acetyltransferase I